MPLKDRILTMYSGSVGDKSSLKRIFNTNIGYSRVPFPMVPVEGQDLKSTHKDDVLVKLNLKARFFWEDMPYGLVILKDIGNIVGVSTPNITRNIIFKIRGYCRWIIFKTNRFFISCWMMNCNCLTSIISTPIPTCISNIPFFFW